MEKKKKMPSNIVSAIQSAKQNITGNAMTVKIVKNSLENIKEEADNNYDLKRFLIKPYVENGAQNFQILHITVLGRNNTHYQFRKISTYMFFPDGYPTTKPYIYFDHLVDAKGKQLRFQHVNVFSDGKLCLEAIQVNYRPDMTLIEILRSLENCIYQDNVDSAANGGMKKAKQTNIKEFNRILAEQSQLLEWQEQDEMLDQDEEP